MESEIKKLIEYIDQLLDYCMSMQAATRYKPKGSPNLLEITRYINKIKGKMRGNKNGNK